MPEWVAASPQITVPAVPRAAVYEQSITPLFAPSRARALLSASAAIELPLGEPDVQSILRTVLRGEAFVSLPRQPVLSIGRGLQLLLDRGRAMEPYVRDVAALARAVLRLAGPERVEVIWFEGCPLYGVFGEDPFTSHDWRPPAPGVPALAVSNLDLGSSGIGAWSLVVPHDWEVVAERLAHRRSTLTAIVPHPLGRTSQRLRRLIRLVTWDRDTGIRRVPAHSIVEPICQCW